MSCLTARPSDGPLHRRRKPPSARRGPFTRLWIRALESPPALALYLALTFPSFRYLVGFNRSLIEGFSGYGKVDREGTSSLGVPTSTPSWSGDGHKGFEARCPCLDIRQRTA